MTRIRAKKLAVAIGRALDQQINNPTVKIIEKMTAPPKSPNVNCVQATGSPDPLNLGTEERRYTAVETDQVAKPKRIRSRHKPLTEADIEVGGVYVPKRGNQHTPTIRVIRITIGGMVEWMQNTARMTSVNKADFLARVSRKI